MHPGVRGQATLTCSTGAKHHGKKDRKVKTTKATSLASRTTFALPAAPGMERRAEEGKRGREEEGDRKGERKGGR